MRSGEVAAHSLEQDEYEREESGAAAMQRYQRRIQRCPQQFVRYAYGGRPMSPYPHRIAGRAWRPPSCEVCGSARSFECQILPSVLYALRVDELGGAVAHLPSDGSDTSVVEDIGNKESSGGVKVPVSVDARRYAEIVGDRDTAGMDFGGVCVWSCERSCAGGMEEVVTLIPPVDV